MFEGIGLLRIVVGAGLLAAAVLSGTISFFTLTSYEQKSAKAHFHIVANYANDVLALDFAEKKNVVLSISKNVALWKSDYKEWPNVVLPGFYDTGIAQRDSASFGDLSFIPLVPLDRQASFEAFMHNYLASDPAVLREEGVSASQVFSYDLAWQTYHDTTAETFTFSSPNRILTPLLQATFNGYIRRSDLGVNLHAMAMCGPRIDAIIACSKKVDYHTAITQCIDLLDIVTLPFGAPREYVTQFFSSFYQPIYLNNNSSRLVGIVGGGFEWITLLSKVFGNQKNGMDIVVRNADVVVTFQTRGGVVYFRGFGDLHETKYDSQMLSIMDRVHAHERMYEPSYSVALFPSDLFYEQYRSNTPTYTAFGSAALLILVAATFYMYDFHMRQETTANEVVLETKRRFVRFISHEIRTPLNAVHLGLGALITEIRRILAPHHSSPENPFVTALKSWLELSVEMTANCDSAEGVLNDLLNYDKIEMSTLRLDFTYVDIWDVVRSSVSAFANQVKLKSIHLTTFNELHSVRERAISQENVPFVVLGDASRLAQVMRNLISNAYKFTPVDGSITVRVERAVDGLLDSKLSLPASSHNAPRAGSVRISVTDSGAGLSEAQLAKICSEGVQFNANELQAGKGSGLGLFITKGIVEQHGGKLIVTSEGIGSGTTFVVELPLFQDLHNDLAKRDRPDGSVNKDLPLTDGSPASNPRTTPHHILVVDDIASNRKMLIRTLVSNGFECEQADDGQQAIDKYLSSLSVGNVFDAITMDFEMPVMDGPTATKKLRDMGCSIPIIGITGNMLTADVDYFRSQGATVVLGKPVNMAKFLDILQRLL